MSGEQYGEDYFENGPETKLSLYDNYRWMPERTLPYCHWLIHHTRTRPDARILDFGCAKGFYVGALRLMGYLAWGCDISDYAIKNSPDEVREHLILTPEGFFPVTGDPWDLIHCKDVLEHIEPDKVVGYIADMKKACDLAFVIVPLADDDGAFVIPSHEEDATHVTRWSRLEWYLALDGKFNHVKDLGEYPCGLKDNYSDQPGGFGFYLCFSNPAHTHQARIYL